MKEVYKEKIEDIYKRLDTSIEGLTSKEANNRLIRDGENKLIEN